MYSDPDKKAARVMKCYGKSEKETRDFMKEKDKWRKQYHNRYCPISWGDSETTTSRSTAAASASKERRR